MGMNYYTTPDETMESLDAMLPWARLTLNAALAAKIKTSPKNESNHQKSALKRAMNFGVRL